jgi:integrase
VGASAAQCGRGRRSTEGAQEGHYPPLPNQARLFLEAARGDRLEVLYMLAIHTGLRQGELLALRWEDVDLQAGVLRVRGTKTARSRRAMKLSQTALEALRSHLTRQLVLCEP